MSGTEIAYGFPGDHGRCAVSEPARAGQSAEPGTETVTDRDRQRQTETDTHTDRHRHRHRHPDRHGQTDILLHTQTH
eukprot:2569546-Rhodomonas_salina.1